MDATQRDKYKMTPNRVHIENVFHNAVRDYGGIVLEDKLPQSPGFQNADYVFHSEKTIAELKCLSVDNTFSDNNKKKIDTLLNDWYVRGEIETNILNQFIFENAPKKLQKTIYEICTKNIHRRIEKANKQIRETKRELRLDDYAGLLILANDGIPSIPPAAFIQATQMALKNHFREIRHFIYFTANMFTSLKETAKPALLWISFDMEDGKKIDTNFLHRLGKMWTFHCGEALGIPYEKQEMNDMKGFWKAKHIK